MSPDSRPRRARPTRLVRHASGLVRPQQAAARWSSVRPTHRSSAPGTRSIPSTDSPEILGISTAVPAEAAGAPPWRSPLAWCRSRRQRPRGFLRNPAAFNNIVGLRPSIGQVPWLTTLPPPCPAVGPGAHGPHGRRCRLILSRARRAGPARPRTHRRPSSFASTLPTTMSATVGWIGDIDGAFACDDAPMALAGRPPTSWPTPVVNSSNWVLCFPVPNRSSGSCGARLSPTRRRYPRRSPARTQGHDPREHGVRPRALSDIMEMERLRVGLRETVTELFDRVDVLALPTTQVPSLPTWSSPPRSPVRRCRTTSVG